MSFEFEAGALIRKHVRNYLERTQFSGYRISWIEQKGFFSSRFFIKGADEKMVFIDLNKWAEKINGS